MCAFCDKWAWVGPCWGSRTCRSRNGVKVADRVTLVEGSGSRGGAFRLFTWAKAGSSRDGAPPAEPRRIGDARQGAERYSWHSVFSSLRFQVTALVWDGSGVLGLVGALIVSR